MKIKIGTVEVGLKNSHRWHGDPPVGLANILMASFKFSHYSTLPSSHDSTTSKRTQ